MSRRTKQVLLFLLVTAGPPLISVLVQRQAAKPDAFRLLGMRGSLAVKRIADLQVSAWSTVSAHAATAYQRARP